MSDTVEIRDSIPDIEQMTRDLARYEKAAHAVQSGVAQLIGFNKIFTTPKHLRVGIDTQKAEQGGLATLLMEKGVFTRAEYVKAVADAMEREKADYEERLSHFMGAKVTLA